MTKKIEFINQVVHKLARTLEPDLHLTLPLREKTPSITQKPQNHCYFCNFDLKVVQIHPFWLIFCLQALFDLPDSILIVSRPKKAKKDQKSKIL